MYLKDYQIKVVTALKQFLQIAREEKQKHLKVKAIDPSLSHDWMGKTIELIGKSSGSFQDRPKNGLMEEYPRVVIKVPTGGGKTLLAVEAIREYQNLFTQRKTGLIVWIVPSETIYTQTIIRLKDKSNAYRQLLDQSSGGRTIILEKGQRLTTGDIEDNLVILFIMIQSLNRKTNESLKVFQDSGGFESFFPADNRYDLHSQLLTQVPNLDYISALGSENPLIKTSLGNAIRISRPLIIIDEFHKVFTDTAKQTIDSLNPECVLGLSATPKPDMNILITVTGLELKDEEMVKLDMHLLPPSSTQENDWKSMLSELIKHREQLEKKANELKQTTGQYIRPITLIQVEATGKDQRGKGKVHSLDVKEFLIDQEINADQVAIKTASQNDIEDVDLFSSTCEVRYIITKEALREGWDCSFAYILGIIPNVNSGSGLTQLVGRILRQPNGRKTGLKELDESYVYYTKGDTRNVLDKVSAGFKNEGLEDLITKMKIRGNESVNATKDVKIKKDFAENFSGSFYLPVWVMITDEKEEKKRRFSYSFDILPYLDFENTKLVKKDIEQIKASLSDENKERQSYTVTINDESKTLIKKEAETILLEDEINIAYATRRFSEIIDNPFLARKKVLELLDFVKDQIGESLLKDHFSFIVSLLTRKLEIDKEIQEEKIFLSHIQNKKLILAVSDDKSFGFKIPEVDFITTTSQPNTFKYYLFDDVEISSMNGLERKIGDILDKQNKILWWFRNRVSKSWYSIQGWQQHRIRPDFVAAKKKSETEIELVYIIEAKGEHLVGNADTQYKKKVMDLMTDYKNKEKIKNYQVTLDFGKINEEAEFYLIEEKKEEVDIKKLMK